MATKNELENNYNRLCNEYYELKEKYNKLYDENKNYKCFCGSLEQKLDTVVDSISNILAIPEIREAIKTIVADD